MLNKILLACFKYAKKNKIDNLMILQTYLVEADLLLVGVSSGDIVAIRPEPLFLPSCRKTVPPSSSCLSVLSLQVGYMYRICSPGTRSRAVGLRHNERGCRLEPRLVVGVLPPDAPIGVGERRTGTLTGGEESDPLTLCLHPKPDSPSCMAANHAENRHSHSPLVYFVCGMGLGVTSCSCCLTVSAGVIASISRTDHSLLQLMNPVRLAVHVDGLPSRAARAFASPSFLATRWR